MIKMKRQRKQKQ